MESKTAPDRSLWLALLPAMVAAAWLVSKAQFYWARNPEMQFGWAVLMLCAFLFWEAWPHRPKAEFRSTGLPLLMVTVSLPIVFLFQIYQAAQGMNVGSLAVFAASLLLIIFANLLWVFGAQGVRHFAFATLFFLLALPMPTVLQSVVVGSLQSLVVAIDLNVLSLMGVPAQRSGNLIQLPSGIVGVNEACSGIRSIQSTLMATLFLGHIILKDRTVKALLLVTGIALAIVGNVARSIYLCLRADAGGAQAVEEAHDAAGWSILIFTSAGVALAAWRFSKLDKRVTELRKKLADKKKEDRS